MSGRRVHMYVHNAFQHDTRVRKEASTLAAAGYDVRVIAAADGVAPVRERRDGFEVLRVASDPAPTRLARRVLAAGGRESGIGAVAAPLHAPRRGPRAALRRAVLRGHLLAEYLKWVRRAVGAAREAPAAVHVAHDLDALPVAERAAGRDGGRVLYDSHELFTERIAIAPAARPAWRALERALLPRADAVLTVSDSIAEELTRRYGGRRPLILRNLPPARRDDGAASPLRDRLGLDAAARVAIYLGGVQPGRGLEPLVEAAARLPDLVVVLMGPGHPDDLAAVRAHADRTGSGDRVVIAPPVPGDEVVRWAAGADVGVALIQPVSLSYRYALPNKLFEYVAAGLPVVASDLPEMASIIRERGLGAVCAPDDPAGVARALSWVLEDAERYARLSAAALAAASELTWERESKVLLDVVGRLAAA